MKKVAVAAAVLAAAAALPASAQVKPEDQIKLRKSAYALMGANFASLAAMAQGKKPYNKDEAARNANLVSTLADFDSKMDKMINETKRLPQAAADLASLKQAVGDVGSACKACHDDYRAK